MPFDPTQAAAGVRLIAHDAVGSTNAEALALARGGERGPLWITARRQPAGRGRRDSAWISPPGNLYATLLLTDPSPADQAPNLSFVAALAVHDVIASLAPALAAPLTLKWPNDLLLAGAKMAGILIEGERIERLTVAIGIGVNCAVHPSNTSYPATDLASAGVTVSVDALFSALAAAMPARLEQWDRGRGFAATRADWLARAAGLGETMRVRLPERELQGRFTGLDDNGRLLLQKPGGAVEAITAGEVFALATAAR